MTSDFFVLTFSDPPTEEAVKDILAKIFTNKFYRIESIYSDLETDISFELRILGDTNIIGDIDKEKYCHELSVFLTKEIILEYEMYNDLIFALKFSQLSGKKALVYSHSDVPYLYLLVDGNEAFLVENEIEDYCISFSTSKRKKLSLSKSLEMLPKREYYETDSEKPAYYVKNGKDWYNCIE